jgi:hypothetical protein
MIDSFLQAETLNRRMMRKSARNRFFRSVTQAVLSLFRPVLFPVIASLPAGRNSGRLAKSQALSVCVQQS